MNYRRPILTLAAAACLLALGQSAQAHLIYMGPTDLVGTGLGAVPTILTMATKNGQSSEESGKVSWDGTKDVAVADPTGVGGPLAGGAYTINK